MNQRKWSGERRASRLIREDYEGIATMIKDRESKERVRFYLKTVDDKLVSFSIPNNEDWDDTIWYYQDLVDAKAEVEVILKWVAKGNGYYEKVKLQPTKSSKAKKRI